MDVSFLASKPVAEIVAVRLPFVAILSK